MHGSAHYTLTCHAYRKLLDARQNVVYAHDEYHLEHVKHAKADGSHSSVSSGSRQARPHKLEASCAS